MPLSGYRILIVEDEALIALDLSQVLQQLQAVVVAQSTTWRTPANCSPR